MKSKLDILNAIVIGKEGGHKSLQMVQRYSHHNQDHIQSGLAKLSDQYKPKQSDT